MKQTLLSAAFVALAACSAKGGDGNYLGTGASPIMPGAAGIGVSGQGAAGTAPLGGAGGQLGAAGATAIAGTGGLGAAGMVAIGGTGGLGAAGMVAIGGSGGAGTGGGQGGAGGAGGAPPVGGTGGGNTPGTVTIQLTTVSYDGEYAPLNYGAIWFEDASGAFIKTAKRWAGVIHATDLVTWTEASGGWPIFGGGADMMDAISSATIRTHQMHMVTWDLMNLDGELVPDGNYVAVLEMSESRASDRAGPVIRIEFTKGPNPQMVEPPAQEGFTGVSLSYEP